MCCQLTQKNTCWIGLSETETVRAYCLIKQIIMSIDTEDLNSLLSPDTETDVA